MKRQALFGQWKTPPQVLYPSSGSGMKKSTSMPAFNTNNGPARMDLGDGSNEGAGPGIGGSHVSPSYPLEDGQDFGDSFLGYDLDDAGVASSQTPPTPVPYHAAGMSGHGGGMPGHRYPGGPNGASSAAGGGAGFAGHGLPPNDMRKVMSQQDLHSQAPWPNSPESMMDVSANAANAAAHQRGGQVRLGLLKYGSGRQQPGASGPYGLASPSTSLSGSPMPVSPSSPQDASDGSGHRSPRGSRGTGKRRGERLDPSVISESSSHAPPAASGYTNPRHSLLSQNGMTFSSSMPSPSATSPYADDDSMMSVSGDNSGRREKRLARNRASAKMRRLKKKTMTDSLELEVKDLLRNIEFLRLLDTRRQTGAGKGATGSRASAQSSGLGTTACPFSSQDMRDAYVASRQPMPIFDEPGMAPKPPAGAKKTQEEEDAAAVQQRIEEELATIDDAELYRMFWKSLVAGPTQDMSVSRPRRRTATEMFTDWQTGWLDYVRTSGAENGAMYLLLADRLAISEAATRATSVRRNTGKNLYYRKPMPAGMPGGAGVGAGLDLHADADELPPASLSAPANNTTTAPPKPKGASARRGGSGAFTQPRKVPGMDMMPRSNLYSDGGAIPNVDKIDPPQSPADVQKRIEALRKDLQNTVHFTDDQRAQIRQLSTGMQKEQICLQAFERIITSLAANEWLMFPAIEEIHEGFRGVLHASQMEKFKAWSMRNLEAIRSLDIVPPRTTQQSYTNL
ncbi:Hypothetical Protein FCC1311_001442 [Hondaea fermentalgiana]|uniref:BZIP domain-containing protein n=1 Tax=Hondaea fermentalgiana TaxID=2315210 RepID=A0A2R5G081_9STRA|nr:Hypothetical Protein FCC1311_001442 [Hondaea fermentalgiana]|eukprot:GBG23925.1 Hypothetical Protein FCC1311_001442 [Hondaea fermentalgiana]